MKNLFKLTLPAVAMMLAASAYAVPTLTITDGAGNTTGALTAPGNGQISFNGSVGDWNVNVLSALSFPLLGSLTQPNIDVGGQDRYTPGSGSPAVGAGGNVLTITFTVDGFVNISGNVIAGIGSTQSNGTTSFNTFANGVALTSSGVITGSPFSNAQIGTLSGFSGTLTEVVTLTANGAEFESVDANLETVPDSGMTLVLLGSSLTVLGLFARSRKVVA
jgi:hypothetical protein